MDLVAVLLAPHHRAVRGPGAGRPAARRRSSPIPVIIETVVGKRRGALMLAVKDLVVDIDGSHILRKVSLEVARRRARLPGRPQRRRQVDHVPHHHGRAQGGIRLDHARGARHHGARALRDRAPGRRLRARGERGVRRPHRRREHPAADLDAADGALRAEEREALAYRVFPRLERYRARGGQQLSGGERKMVSIARALAARSKAAAAGRADGRVCRPPSCRRSSTASPRSVSSATPC